jgi:hypothetical protein
MVLDATDCLAVFRDLILVPPADRTLRRIGNQLKMRIEA